LAIILRNERRLRVFENRMLRKMFGCDREGTTGEWSKLNSEEFYGLYCTSDIIRVTKSRQTRWTGHVARMGEERCIQGFGEET
jgi:hypothetical protein